MFVAIGNERGIDANCRSRKVVGDKMSEVNKFAPGLNVQWHFQDILLIFSAIALAGFIFSSIFSQPVGRGWPMDLDRGLR